MKNLFKYVGALAIAGTISLQATNVYAANSCPAGQKKHTDYFMFLNVGTAKTYDGITDKAMTYYTAADKTNNILNKTKIDDETGLVRIQTETGNDSNTPDSQTKETWTVTEYWRKYYEAKKKLDNRLVYTNGDESYVFHKVWYRYDENENLVEATASDNQAVDKLSEYIDKNLDILSTSDLVTNGTSLPNTTITPTYGFEDPKENIRFRVMRSYNVKDKKTGFDLNETGTSNLEDMIVFSPGAYKVVYCVDDKSGEPSEKEYTVTYDANGGENAPSSQNFKENSCFTVGNAPTRTDYTFLGWSTDKNATEPDDEYNVGAQACNVNKDITLYAVWKPMQYNSDGTFTVTYDANGGKDAPAPSTGKKGSCVKISDGKPTFAGLNFLGWSKDKNAKEPDKNFNAGTDYCGDNVTLYAVWQTKTGVSAHLIGFGLAAVAAGTALVVAKKKDLFKQI